MIVKQVLNNAASRLKLAGINEPNANAEWLLAAVLKIKRTELFALASMPISEFENKCFEAFLCQKMRGLPLAYILGNQEFIDIKLKVDKRVLIPRPETEELALYAAKFLKHKANSQFARILDYGTGSGAIGLWLLKQFKNIKLIAADSSYKALECARENAAALGLSERVQFVHTNLPKKDILGDNFALIVANPPYVKSGDMQNLPIELSYEPRLALNGGKDGLSVARLIFKASPALLCKGGALFMELSDGAPARLKAKAHMWSEIYQLADLAGKKRFLFAISRLN